MDLEKLGSRAKSTLLIVSFFGLLMAAAGVVLTLMIVSRSMQPGAAGTPAGEEWINGLSLATGPMPPLRGRSFPLSC